MARNVNIKQIAIVFILVVLFLGLSYACFVYLKYSVYFGQDFHIYQAAYAKASNGLDPYLPYNIGSSFLYHPFSLTLFSLFSGKLLAWTFASLACWLGSIGICFAMRPEPFFPSKPIVLLMLLFFGPFLEVLYVGQINAIVLFFICLSYFFFARNKMVSSGVALSFAIVLKTSPALLIVYFLAKKQIKPIISTVVGVISLSLISAIQFSPSILLDFVHTLISVSKEIQPDRNNLSLASFVYQVSTQQMADVVSVLLKIFLVGFVIIILYAAYRGKADQQSIFSSLMIILVLFSPLIWYHHLLFLLPVIVFLSPNTLVLVLLFSIQSERLLQIINPSSGGLIGFVLMGLLAWQTIKLFKFSLHRSGATFPSS